MKIIVHPIGSNTRLDYESVVDTLYDFLKDKIFFTNDYEDRVIAFKVVDIMTEEAVPIGEGKEVIKTGVLDYPTFGVIFERK